MCEIRILVRIEVTVCVMDLGIEIFSRIIKRFHLWVMTKFDKRRDFGCRRYSKIISSYFCLIRMDLSGD